MSRPQTDSSNPVKSRVEELLKAANDSAGAARNAWLAFLGILAYLFVTVTSTSHVNLLTNDPVNLPIANIKVPLFGFFFAAPLIFLLLHLGLFVQHAVMARKLNALNSALKDATKTEPESYANQVRKRLHFYAFAQYLTGPYSYDATQQEKPGQAGTDDNADDRAAPRTHAWLVRLMLWISFVILPILTFLAFQISFLPYHDMSAWEEGRVPRVGLTWWHRLFILADLFLVWSYWPVIRYGKSSWKKSFNCYPRRWKVAKITTTALVGLFSFLVATIPDEKLDQIMADRLEALSVERGGRKVFWPTAWLFEGELDPSSLTLKSPFSRNLIVAIEDLVDDGKKWDVGKSSHNLRNRNLRYGQFARIDLSYADLSYADLTKANFFRARLKRASLFSATIKGTRFERANLELASFMQAVGNHETDFKKAIANKADFRGVRLPGASFKRTKLINAEFQKDTATNDETLVAYLEGAVFARANLRAADLSGAKLQAATFWEANLQATNLEGADMMGADLRGAAVWRADYPDKKDRRESDESKRSPEHLYDMLGVLEYADLGKVQVSRSENPDCWQPRKQTANECRQAFREIETSGLSSSIEWRLDYFKSKEVPGGAKGESGDVTGVSVNPVLREPWDDGSHWKARERKPRVSIELARFLSAVVCRSNDKLEAEFSRRLKNMSVRERGEIPSKNLRANLRKEVVADFEAVALGIVKQLDHQETGRVRDSRVRNELAELLIDARDAGCANDRLSDSKTHEVLLRARE